MMKFYLFLFTIFLCYFYISRGYVSSETPREIFDQVDIGLNGGDGYKYYNNENATLAWGESYIMMSYVMMYEGTGDRYYLDKLADHGDHVMLQRDDFRGVTDYRGVSSAAWRNTHYQPNDEPYCYVVHSGMITYPIIRFTEEVYRDQSVWSLTTYDGWTYKDKADWFLERVKETEAAHADQWRRGPGPLEGYYVFRPDAYFLSYPGVDLPLNQQNAFGRTLICLSRCSPDGLYHDKSTRLARYFEDNLTLDGAGAYVWNYWGGAYIYPGEDISHGAINVDFALQCFMRHTVFNGYDIEAFANTFTEHVVLDVNNSYRNVGGGGTVNTYRTSLGRWCGLTRFDPAVYAYVRNIYDRKAPSTTSGAEFVGFAAMAQWEMAEERFDFYALSEWQDHTTYMEGITTAPNLQHHPADRDAASVMRIVYASDQRVNLEQYGPGLDPSYQKVVILADTNGLQDYCFFTYNPDWYYSYSGAEVLFQFDNGLGLKVYRDGSSIGSPLPTVTPAPSPTPTPTGHRQLSFTESDNRHESLVAYHFLDVLVNNKLVFSRDIGWSGDIDVDVDLVPDDLLPGDQKVITFRLREAQGVSNYGIQVEIGEVELIIDGNSVPLNSWIYSETVSAFTTGGVLQMSLPSNTGTQAGDFCQYSTISWLPTPTSTPTISPTSTNTNTPTRTFSPTFTQSPTFSPTESPTISPTRTATETPTRTPSPTFTRSPTFSPSESPTISPTRTATETPTRTPSPTFTRSPTLSPTESPTISPTRTATETPTPTPSPTFTRSPTCSATSSPSSTPTGIPTDQPAHSPTPSPSAVPSIPVLSETGMILLLVIAGWFIFFCHRRHI